jgi:hypothetical protein
VRLAGASATTQAVTLPSVIACVQQADCDCVERQSATEESLRQRDAALTTLWAPKVVAMPLVNIDRCAQSCKIQVSLTLTTDDDADLQRLVSLIHHAHGNP